jgi:hypothetical protein
MRDEEYSKRLAAQYMSRYNDLSLDTADHYK